ncbi:MAG: c-type cytochrome [Acidobacteria bacterium]|nr:c-type cytochrome [Acidobacteriota bacterium]
MFMRLLAPPTPSTTSPGGAQSIANGSRVFTQIGCALCHTPTMKTGPSAFTPSLSNANANLFSDLLVHHMGSNLADGVSQGGAAVDEFRTAPLWGLGQRIFFLHDGRSNDLIDTINQHAGRGSEANEVIEQFQRRLNPQQQQDLLNFLRSL